LANFLVATESPMTKKKRGGKMEDNPTEYNKTEISHDHFTTSFITYFQGINGMTKQIHVPEHISSHSSAHCTPNSMRGTLEL